ncbi:MAG: helix-turn-helix domain-containing protein [Candidatus Tectomicrobia bacterium]|nr:helix-turn-helix domain-containing protein [Candidatus Tectomicrobia bacterium]
MKARTTLKAISASSENALFNGRDGSEAVMGVAEVANLLRCTKKAVYQAVSRGQLPFRKRGRRVIFLHDEVMEFLRWLPGASVEEALHSRDEG